MGVGAAGHRLAAAVLAAPPGRSPTRSTRLCAALSLGRHVCEVAVLFPTATAQAGSTLDGPRPAATRAQEVYRELVGDLTWFRPCRAHWTGRG